ncbi:MAG: InlB B-repeat-containing protein, partial [Paludibacteraceae bacterium]|nr:InlB B-repeat-containing protein [Paludibacteraceae bacterium]
MRRFFLLAFAALMSLASAAHTITILNPAKGGTASSSATEADKDAKVILTLTPSAGYEVKNLLFTDANGEQVFPALDWKSDVEIELTMPDYSLTLVPSFIMKPVYATEEYLRDGTIKFSWTRPFEGATFELYVLEEDPTSASGMPAGAQMIQTADTFYTGTFSTELATAHIFLRVCISETEKGEWQRFQIPVTGGKVLRIDMADQYGDGWNGAYFTAIYPDGTQRRICLDDYNRKMAAIIIPWAETIQFVASAKGDYPEEVLFYVVCLSDFQDYVIDFDKYDSNSDYPVGEVFYTYETLAPTPTNIYSECLNTSPDTTFLSWYGGTSTAWNAVISKEPVETELLDTLVYYHADDDTWKAAHGLVLLNVTQSPDTVFAGDPDTHYYVYVQGMQYEFHSGWASHDFLSGGRVPTEADFAELTMEAHFTEFNMADVFISGTAKIFSVTDGYPYRVFKYTPTQDTTLIPYGEGMEDGIVYGECAWYCSPSGWDSNNYASDYEFSLTGGATYYFLFVNRHHYGSYGYGIRLLKNQSHSDTPIEISYQQSGSLTTSNTEACYLGGNGWAMTQYMGTYTPEEDMGVMYEKEAIADFYILCDTNGVYWDYFTGNSYFDLQAGKKYDFYLSADGPVDYAMTLTRVYADAPMDPLDTLHIDTMQYTPKRAYKDRMFSFSQFGTTPYVNVFEYAFTLPADTNFFVAAYHPNLDTVYARIYKGTTLRDEIVLRRSNSFIGTPAGKLEAGDYHVCFICKADLLPAGDSIQVKLQYKDGKPDPNLIQPLALNEVKSGSYFDLHQDIHDGLYTTIYRMTLSDTTVVRIQEDIVNKDIMYIGIAKDSLLVNWVSMIAPGNGYDYVELVDTTYYLAVFPMDDPKHNAWEFSLTTCDSYHLRPYTKNIPLGKIVSDTVTAGEKELVSINTYAPMVPANDYNVQMEAGKTYRISMAFATTEPLHFHKAPWSEEEHSITNVVLLTSGELQGGYDDFNGDELANYSDYYLGGVQSGNWSWLFTSPETGNVRMYVQPWVISGTMPYTLFIEEMNIEEKDDTLTLRQLLDATTEKVELPYGESSAFLNKSTFVKGDDALFRVIGEYYHAAAFRTTLAVGEELTVLMQGIGMNPWTEIYRIDASDNIQRLSNPYAMLFDYYAQTCTQTIVADATADYYIVCTSEYSDDIGSWTVSIAKGNMATNLDIYDVETDEALELSVTPASLKLHGSKKGNVAEELGKLALKAGELDLVNDVAYWTIGANKATLLYPTNLLPVGYCFKDNINSAEVPFSFYWNVTFLNANGGTIVTKQVDEGTAAVAPDAPAKEGYDFKGWDTDFSNVTADLTVNPLFTIKTFTVKFVDWDDTTLKTETVEWDKDATAPAEPTRSGYTFIGWD